MENWLLTRNLSNPTTSFSKKKEKNKTKKKDKTLNVQRLKKIV
jgi:hypothetical protein